MSESTSALPNGFDILQKMWDAFSPSAALASPLTQLMQHTVPLVDPGELEKRIAEMRAVEQWLTLNANMLRSTIQAFEVQRATYATLKAFGDTFAHPSGEAAAGAAPKTAPADKPEPAAAGAAGQPQHEAPSPFAQAASAYGALDPAQWWNVLCAQFDQITAAAQAAAPAPSASAAAAAGESAGSVPPKPAGKPRARKTGGAGSGKSRTKKPNEA